MTLLNEFANLDDVTDVALPAFLFALIPVLVILLDYLMEGCEEMLFLEEFVDGCKVVALRVQEGGYYFEETVLEDGTVRVEVQ